MGKEQAILSLNADLYLGLSEAHRFLGDPKSADKFLQRAQEYDPDERNPFVLLRVGQQLCAESRELERGKKLFLKSIVGSSGTVLSLCDQPEIILDMLGLKLEKGEFGYDFQTLPILASYQSFCEANPDAEDPREAFALSYLTVPR